MPHEAPKIITTAIKDRHILLTPQIVNDRLFVNVTICDKENPGINGAKAVDRCVLNLYSQKDQVDLINIVSNWLFDLQISPADGQAASVATNNPAHNKGNESRPEPNQT